MVLGEKSSEHLSLRGIGDGKAPRGGATAGAAVLGSVFHRISPRPADQQASLLSRSGPAPLEDRLDVLAVEDTGELVLTESKVDDSFRVTDLQALAYAGAHASTPTTHLAGVLRKHLERQGVEGASGEMAQEQIASFVGLDE